MITAASLKSQTVKDLGQMAKEIGVSGWHSMRKDQLVRALVRASKRQSPTRSRKSSSAKGSATRTAKSPKRTAGSAKRSANGKRAASGGKRATAKAAPKAAPKRRATPAKAGGSSSRRTTKSVSAKTSSSSKSQTPPQRKSPRVMRRIQRINADRERQKDLSTADEVAAAKAPRRNGKAHANGRPQRDRIVLLVRDSYWLQACWDVTRQSVQRAKAAMAEHWHTSRPVLRVIEVETGATTSAAERVSRDIEIHGGVKNWYIDVKNPPRSFRVEIGYLALNGKFHALARSNTVSTPNPASSDALDENWTDVAENYEKIFAQSGGYSQDNANGELRELFEERLRRPMGSPMVARYGAGAERMVSRKHDFHFEVDAELIIYGATKPDAHVTLAGEPVKLRPDGTFTVRQSLPDRRQVLPVVAASADGLEQRTTVLAVERNTKVMEPVVHEGNE